MAALVWTIVTWIMLVCSAAWILLSRLSPQKDHSSPAIIALTALITLLPLPLVAVAVLAVLWSVPTTIGIIQCVLATILALLSLLPSLGYVMALPDQVNRFLKMPLQKPHHHLLDLLEKKGDDTAVLRVMTLNARYGHADAESIIRTVKNHHVDVLALQEVTPDLMKRLDTAGMSDVLPVRLVGDKGEKDNGGVNALYAADGLDARPWNPGLDIQAAHPVAFGLRVDTHAAAHPSDDSDTTSESAQNAPVHVRRVRVLSVHTASPQRGAERWSDGQAELARFADAYVPGTPDDPKPVACPLVIMGDFNATQSHPSFRAMLHAGPLFDCSYELHHGSHLSFPASWVVVPPLLELDHIVHTSGAATGRMRSVHIHGTDHRAQIAELHLY